MTAELLVSSLQLSMPEIILAVGAMVLLMIGVFSGSKSSSVVTGLSVALLIISGLWLVLVSGEGAAFGGSFINDDFAKYMKVLTLIGSITAMVMAVGHAQEEQTDRFEFPVLIVLATLGMMLMISATDLIALYLGIELQSLALYVIAAINRDNTRSTEAGLKYFVLGALSSGIGLVFLLSGIAFKISAVPFHMWTPDVYEGAPTPVTAFFSAAPKIAAMAMLVRIVIGAFEPIAADWQQIIVFVSIASMVLGAFAAIGQRNIKRLMAYSSIGHMGYALVGLAAGSLVGVRGVAIYMLVYMVTTLGTFACILAMRRKEEGNVEQIDDLAGLSKTNPLMATILTIFMFSLAGIPFMAGFFAKYFVFVAAIEAGLVALAVIGVLASVVGSYYYLRIIKLMWFDEANGSFVPVSGELRLVMGVSGLFVLGYVLIGGPIGRAAETAAKTLFLAG